MIGLPGQGLPQLDSLASTLIAHGAEAAEAHGEMSGIVFGMDAMWASTGVLLITYAVLLSEKINRTIVALIGAGVVITSGLLSQDRAIGGIDFNTIALLTGMMIVVAIARQTGLFEYVAIWSAKKVKADPRGILVMLALVTATFSAFLDNLTTVLLVVPVALLIVDKLKVSPMPFLVTQILASNVGGTATLIGDPPNILIGSATGFTFMDFLVTLGPVAALIMLGMALFFYAVMGRGLQATPERRARVMEFSERDSITDVRLLKQSLFMLFAIISGFIIGEHYGIRPGTTAMFGASTLLLLTSLGKNRKGQADVLHHAFNEVEWGALFFFIGLFIVVHGVEASGFLKFLGDQLMLLTGGDLATTTFSVLWVSAIVSAAIDNIPFVATMIPMVEGLEPVFGGRVATEPVWWALALGACLGGNGSLIGAAANVMVAGLGERSGTPISFVQYLKIGLPVMLVSILVSSVYLWVLYFL